MIMTNILFSLLKLQHIDISSDRAELKSKCDIDVLSWFKNSPAQSSEIKGKLNLVYINVCRISIVLSVEEFNKLPGRQAN